MINRLRQRAGSSAAGADVEGDQKQDPAGASAEGATTAQALRAAAGRPPATRVRPEHARRPRDHRGRLSLALAWTTLIPLKKPNLNTGTPWSSWDDQDIRLGLDQNRSIEETADFLCRTPSEVRQRIREIAEADAIGDPSLLRDGLTHRDRIALETYRDAAPRWP